MPLTPDRLKEIKERWASPGCIILLSLKESTDMALAITGLLAEVERLQKVGRHWVKHIRQQDEYYRDDWLADMLEVDMERGI